jgi:hypothetical protein
MTEEVAVTSDVKPLSEIFGGKPDTAAKPEPAKVDDQKPAEVKPADDGKGANAGETPAPKAEDKKPDPPKDADPIKAMRKALNATQRELARLREEREKPAPITPDPIADADGYSKHLEQTVSDTLWKERLADAHEDLTEKLGEDAYSETMDVFVEMMKERPELYGEWRNSRNPGKFLLKAVEDHKSRQEIGDPKAFADRIRAEERTKMMGEVEKMVAEGIKKALGQRLPQSLADEQTQGSNSSDAAPAEFHRKSLDSILNRKR